MVLKMAFAYHVLLETLNYDGVDIDALNNYEGRPAALELDGWEPVTFMPEYLNQYRRGQQGANLLNVLPVRNTISGIAVEMAIATVLFSNSTQQLIIQV